ncbi:uncharacterized protein LOC132546214 [Ylistrum balloti]|uniref:uncharacterized protein LOC132546214 n=1 Tax=Ylistrum balloti TaxID=509963 RepID=UPI0029057E69|nr:uncharacterized protein LOC132546214 [Ylistrum balloti]
MSSNIGTSIGGAFINWFSEDVMPKVATAVDLTILLVSIILNVLLIVMFNKKHLFLDPANRFMFQLIIVDILSWFFILIPGAVVALRGQWDLTMPVCYAQAVIVNWIYLVMFGLITTLFVERAVLVKNPKLRDKIFGKVSKVTIISIMIWSIDLAIAAIPTSGWSPIDYDFYHSSCIVYNESNVYYVIILFMFGIGTAILSGAVCIPIILNSRKSRILRENAEAAKIEADIRRKMRLEAIAEEKKEMEAEKIKNGQDSSKKLEKSLQPQARQGWTNDKPSNSKTNNNAKKKQTRKKTRRARTPKRRDKRLLEDDYEDPDFHLTVTYMIMWVLLLVLWLPYFIVLFRHAAINDTDFWRGYYSVTVILALFSFCIKPIIYLSHNRHMQEKTKDTIPENVVNRASALRMSFGDVVDKLDKIVFKSPRTQPSIQTTVKAHTIAMKWMNKSNVKDKSVKQEADVASEGSQDEHKHDQSESVNDKEGLLNLAAPADGSSKVTSPTPTDTNTAADTAESALIDMEESDQGTGRWPAMI